MIASSRDVVTSPPPPTQAELQRIANGDQLECRRLIDSWERPIKVIASSYTSRPSDIDDLMQVGRLAVYHSALKFDVAFDVPFGNYAKRSIKNSVMQEAVRLARQRRLEASLDRYEDKGGNPVEELVDEGGQFHQIKEWVLELPEPHATIFRLLYVEKMKQRKAAEELQVSQPRVAQLNRSFLNLARAAFAS